MLKGVLWQHRQRIIIRCITIFHLGVAARQQHSQSKSNDTHQRKNTKAKKKAQKSSSCVKKPVETATHSYTLQNGIKNVRIISNQHENMYGRCGSPEKALEAFDSLPDPPLGWWIRLITTFAQKGHSNEALWAFGKVLQAGIRPNEALLAVVLAACQDLEHGKLIHSVIREVPGMQNKVTICTALVTMYGSCGSLESSKLVFEGMRCRDAASWNAWMMVLVDHGYHKMALEAYDEMEKARVVPSVGNFVPLLRACDELHQVSKIHRKVALWKFENHPVVAAGLIESYGRCGEIQRCVGVFQNAGFSKKRVTRGLLGEAAAWTALILVHARNGLGKQGLEIFHKMQVAHVLPGAPAYVAALEACRASFALTEGKLIHARIVDEKLRLSSGITSALIGMYSDCGLVEEAWGVFATAVREDDPGMEVWNSIISAMARHGKGYEALRTFQQMQQCGSRPDERTFESLLRACCYDGLAVAGVEMFRFLRVEYMNCVSDGCCASMIELVARRGSSGDGLKDAEELVKRVEGTNLSSWVALLSACINFEDEARAKRVAAKVIVMDPKNHLAAAVLQNLYQREGRVEHTTNTAKLDMYPTGWIEVAGVLHEFGGPWNREDAPIVELLQKLKKLMVKEGFSDAHCTCQILYSNEQGLGEVLWMHGVKRAVVFGILNTHNRESLCVFKKLRLCLHCHVFVGFVAKITQREIFVRDSSRFHHFSASQSCSCGDYW